MSDIVQGNLGPVTAYAYAKAGGYTGTEEEFQALMAANVDAAQYAADVMAAAEQAEEDKDAAAESASEAAGSKTAAETAQAAAETAANYARAFTGAPRVAATAASMTDQSLIYVYTGSETGYTAGNWYYWDGTAWASGGVYNSTAIETDETLTVSGAAADAKVTGDEIGALKSALNQVTVTSLNLLNPNDPDFLTGEYYDTTNTKQTNANIKQSGFIPVSYPNKYTSNYKTGFVLWYLADKTFSSSTSAAQFAQDGYVAPAYGVAYARFLATASLQEWQVVQGETVPEYKPYGTVEITSDVGAVVYNNSMTLTESEKSVTRENIGAISADTLQTAVKPYEAIAKNYIFSKNLLNPDDPDVVTNGYYNKTNTYTSANGYYQSGYIPVEVGKKYTSMPQNLFVLWFDSNKSLVGYTDTADFMRDGYVSPLSGSAYGRFITTSAYYDVWQVEEGTTPTAYTPYGTAYQATEFNGLDGVAFGTSLTYRAQSTGGYLQYLPSLTGIEFDNQGIGNATILVTSDYPELDILNAVKTYANYATKDVCILEGFVNDFYRNADKLGTWKDTGETTVCGCVRSALNYIQTQNPDITVFMVLDHYGCVYNGVSTASTYTNTNGDTQYEYYEAIAKVAESMGVIVIKGYQISEMNEHTPGYFIDNIHPSANGARQFANTIYSAMKQYLPKVVSN